MYSVKNSNHPVARFLIGKSQSRAEKRILLFKHYCLCVKINYVPPDRKKRLRRIINCTQAHWPTADKLDVAQPF